MDRSQFERLHGALALLCERHLALDRECSSAQAALQCERDEVEAGRQKIEQLHAQLAAERRDKSALQARYDAAMKATVSREEKAELLSLRAIFGEMQKRLQRVEIANQQLEQLVDEHDIPVPLNIHMFQPSVSQPHARTALRGGMGEWTNRDVAEWAHIAMLSSNGCECASNVSSSSSVCIHLRHPCRAQPITAPSSPRLAASFLEPAPPTHLERQLRRLPRPPSDPFRDRITSDAQKCSRSVHQLRFSP